MRRRTEPEQPADPTGQELTQFFAGLNDESKLREYHADPEAYVQAQQELGVVSADASQLILSADLQQVQASMARGGDSTVSVVFPPM